MKKKVFKTTFHLLMISAIAKLLSFVIRITIARLFTEEAISYYSLATPVLMFLMTLSNFGIPNALTKLVASKKDARQSISASIILSVVNNLLLCIVCLLGIPLYARIILKQDVLIPVLYACVPMLPMVMATGLLKGYFMGKQKLLLASSSQITEELFRFLFLIIFYPSISNHPVSMASFAIFTQTIGEIGSCMHLSLSLLYRKKERLKNIFPLQFNLEAFRELLSFSVPMTASRMTGSLTSFLEPIVIMNFSSTLMKDIYIQLYSQLNTYILPLITFPSFFSVVLSSWILPAFSQSYEHHRKNAKFIFSASTLFCFALGILCSLIFFLFSTEICHFLYHKTEMADLLKKISLPFALYAMQPVLTSILHGASKSTRAMMDTVCGCILRLISLSILCLCNVQHASIYALIISSCTTTLLHLHGCLSLFINRQKSLRRP